MTDQNQSERIIHAFQRLGVPVQEARPYLSLLDQNGISGYQLSKNAGIQSSKIYGVLKRLTERGFVINTDTKPLKYFACPPGQILGKIEKELSATVSNLDEALKSLKVEKKISETLAWNITGRGDVIHKAKAIIDASEKAIFMAAWPKEMRPLRVALTRAVKRKVKLQLVTYGATNFNQGTIYVHRPTDYLSRESGEHRFILISDNDKSVIANMGDNGSANGLWTENRGLVLLFRDFVIHEIYIVKVEEAYPREIKELVGRNWEKARLTF